MLTQNLVLWGNTEWNISGSNGIWSFILWQEWETTPSIATKGPDMESVNDHGDLDNH